MDIDVIHPDAVLCKEQPSVEELFAVLRQWEPIVQARATDIIRAILDQGFSVV